MRSSIEGSCSALMMTSMPIWKHLKALSIADMLNEDGSSSEVFCDSVRFQLEHFASLLPNAHRKGSSVAGEPE